MGVHGGQVSVLFRPRTGRFPLFAAPRNMRGEGSTQAREGGRKVGTSGAQDRQVPAFSVCAGFRGGGYASPLDTPSPALFDLVQNPGAAGSPGPPRLHSARGSGLMLRVTLRVTHSRKNAEPFIHRGSDATFE